MSVPSSIGRPAIGRDCWPHLGKCNCVSCKRCRKRCERQFFARSCKFTGPRILASRQDKARSVAHPLSEELEQQEFVSFRVRRTREFWKGFEMRFLYLDGCR